VALAEFVNVDAVAKFNRKSARRRVTLWNGDHVAEMVHGVVVAEAACQWLDVQLGDAAGRDGQALGVRIMMRLTADNDCAVYDRPHGVHAGLRS